ncbi:MAG: T9SS type A sorting domain-containing protein, partial [bacterium]
NINYYPAFVDIAHHDYRLLWGSPCIDSGDPDPQYNDPDGTRADMGAFYYDQSTLVRVLLTPHEIPYLIPVEGGTLDYTIRAFNRDSVAHDVTIWCDIARPDSSIYGPTLGPVTVSVRAGALISRVRTQSVPPSAPLGVYHYNAYAVVGQDTSKDSFMFGKLGTGGLELGAGSWSNTGESLFTGAQIPSGSETTPTTHPLSFSLYPCSPNPFNPSTTIRFDLPIAAQVTLEVFDVNGRMVGAHCMRPAELGTRSVPLQQWYPAGTHEISFDGSGLPSGMYIYRLTAGEWQGSGKMVLLK